MATSLRKVRAALEPDEPNYSAAAADLGADALPHLQTLIHGDDLNLASKAVYLASLIPDEGAPALVRAAAQLDDPVMRVAAAAAARNLESDTASELLVDLVGDDDPGVRKVAQAAAPEVPSAALQTALAQGQPDSEPSGDLPEPIPPVTGLMPGEARATLSEMPGGASGRMPGESATQMPGG
jgi:HEAT repeat protein